MKELLKLSKPIILASQSPRRKKLLEQIGLEFKVISSDIDEKEHPTDINPQLYAEQLALKKAMDVSTRVKEDSIIIGADTIVVIDDMILNKPVDRDDAVRMLGKLSNNTHTVYTAVAIVDTATNRNFIQTKATKVTFRHLSDEEIDAYVATGSPLDKAGAYGIQDDFGAVFISNIEGCYYNIVGLPLEMLYTMLKKLNS